MNGILKPFLTERSSAFRGLLDAATPSGAGKLGQNSRALERTGDVLLDGRVVRRQPEFNSNAGETDLSM